MTERRRKIKLITPPKASFCVAMILFFALVAMMLTYCSIDGVEMYERVTNTLRNGQLVECEFKEVGRQVRAPGTTYGDGYNYYAIYEYTDENGNHYKTESSREFKSTEAVLKYVESHPTKSLYIDGNGFSMSGDETVAKYTAKGIVIIFVTVGCYAVIIGFAIQLIRRIKINIKETKENNNESD